MRNEGKFVCGGEGGSWGLRANDGAICPRASLWPCLLLTPTRRHWPMQSGAMPIFPGFTRHIESSGMFRGNSEGYSGLAEGFFWRIPSPLGRFFPHNSGISPRVVPFFLTSTPIFLSSSTLTLSSLGPLSLSSPPSLSVLRALSLRHPPSLLVVGAFSLCVVPTLFPPRRWAPSPRRWHLLTASSPLSFLLVPGPSLLVAAAFSPRCRRLLSASLAP